MAEDTFRLELVQRLARIEEGVKGLYTQQAAADCVAKGLEDRVDNLEVWKTRLLTGLSVLAGITAPGSWVHAVLANIKI